MVLQIHQVVVVDWIAKSKKVWFMVLSKTLNLCARIPNAFSISMMALDSLLLNMVYLVSALFDPKWVVPYHIVRNTKAITMWNTLPVRDKYVRSDISPESIIVSIFNCWAEAFHSSCIVGQLTTSTTHLLSMVSHAHSNRV